MPAQSYWVNITDAFATLSQGLSLTFSHLVKSIRKNNPTIQHDIRNPKYFQEQRGITTVQYPHEQLPVPENGRYQLHNEIDDCIVCDKCVKVCPVNCITIEPVRSEKEFGKTSDGSPKKIYAAKFDIDMGKCCFCGLCTTVCPTECLTMTLVFDFSSYGMDKHYFKFADMSEGDILLRKKEWEDYQKAKQSALASGTVAPVAPKPVFKPKILIKPNPNPPQV